MPWDRESDEEYDDGYTRESFERADEDTPEDCEEPPGSHPQWGEYPCVHGHVACSHREGGPCLDETLAQRADAHDRIADRIDGYDLDDLGESPDF